MAWQTKKLGIDCLIVVLSTIVIVGIFGFPQFSTQLNLLALLVTLVVLIWYAYDTHRIADQTVEANLRPLILRSGFIESWENIRFSTETGILEGKPIEFSILKNIAKDISGYIVISKKKYQLLFANHISRKDDGIRLVDSYKPIEYRFEPNWGWMNAGTMISAIFESSKYEEINEDNQIYLIYSDMEGNKYFTRENKNFSQDSGKF